MRGLSKVKAWLEKRGFTQAEQQGDTKSEYYQMKGLPVTVRLGDHLGRYSTISDKYINLLPGYDVGSYVIVVDKVMRVVRYKELVEVLESFISLYCILPEYLKSKTDMKKDFQQREHNLTLEVDNLKKSITLIKSKFKDKLGGFNKALKKINNDIVIEMNNL